VFTWVPQKLEEWETWQNQTGRLVSDVVTLQSSLNETAAKYESLTDSSSACESVTSELTAQKAAVSELRAMVEASGSEERGATVALERDVASLREELQAAKAAAAAQVTEAVALRKSLDALTASAAAQREELLRELGQLKETVASVKDDMTRYAVADD